MLHIAMDAGFQSQAAFTRAFRKVYHTTPASWRARGQDVPWLSTAPISESVLSLLPGLGENQPRLEHIPPFDVEGICITIDGESRTRIPDLWAHLAHRVGIQRLVQSENIGISIGDKAVLDGILRYMAGLAVANDAPTKDGLERWTISGGAYLVFRFEGPFALVAQAYDTIFSIWMPGSRYSLRAEANFTRPHANNRHRNHGRIDIWVPVEG